jgi:hypothetical protein
MGQRSRAIHDYSYQIHVVDETDAIIETIGEVDIFSAAKAAFEACLGHKTYSLVQLRQGGRIIETAKTGLYDSKTKTVPVLWRKR